MEIRRGDALSVQSLGLGRSRQCRLPWLENGEGLEQAAARGELAIGAESLGTARSIGACVRDSCDALRMRVRKRLEQNRVRSTENRCSRADAQGQGQHTDCREAQVLPQ